MLGQLNLVISKLFLQQVFKHSVSFSKQETDCPAWPLSAGNQEKNNEIVQVNEPNRTEQKEKQLIASYKISKLFYGNLLRASLNIQNFSDQGLFKQQCSNFRNENSVLITLSFSLIVK